MEKIIFECETITPMFSYGADGKTPEIRPTSIKGLLRFWWRALHGDLPLEELKEKEDDLFGGTTNRSKVIIRVQTINAIISSSTFKKLNRQRYDLIYMAYGAVDKHYYEPGTKFKVIFSVKEKNLEQQKIIKKEILHAFSLLSILGGIGAKSRNGFGAFVATGTDSFDEIITHRSFQIEKKSEFTSISNLTQIYRSSRGFNNWKSAMRELKELYADNKKAIFPKNSRVYIGAPWKNVPIPARHAKLHIMSIMPYQNSLKYIISYLPYNYLAQYPELNQTEINTKYNEWNHTVQEFNNYIENDSGVNKGGNYLVDFTFDGDK